MRMQTKPWNCALAVSRKAREEDAASGKKPRRPSRSSSSELDSSQAPRTFLTVAVQDPSTASKALDVAMIISVASATVCCC